MTKDLLKDKDTIFRRVVEAIRRAIDLELDIAEVPKVKVSDLEFDTYVKAEGWEEALEKAKLHFVNIEDYEMCQVCVSLSNQIKKSKT